MKQDDLSRQRRLNHAQCPDHGAPLAQVDTTSDGFPVVVCTRRGCSFMRPIKRDSKTYQALKKTG